MLKMLNILCLSIFLSLPKRNPNLENTLTIESRLVESRNKFELLHSPLKLHTVSEAQVMLSELQRLGAGMNWALSEKYQYEPITHIT